MRLIFLGAPGAGKGTQAEFVSRRLDIPTISTGNILREAMKKGTKVGLRAKEYVESGRLVPDDVIIGIVSERLAEEDCKNGYILDGVPRTIEQAKALEASGIEFDFVLSLEVSDEDIEKRLAGRRVCSSCSASFHTESNPPKKENICDTCGSKLVLRDDDAPETVRARLKVYHENTEPLKDFYESRGKLRNIAGQNSVEETTKMVYKALGLE